MGGPPCQGFSTAGKRQVMDPRNSLVFEFVRLVCEMQPKTMVFENVPGILDMVTPEGVPVVDQMCRLLEEGDFGPYETLRKAMLGFPDARAMTGSRRPRHGEEGKAARLRQRQARQDEGLRPAAVNV